ncbi:MAG: hypothetical protein HOC74_12940 [Gemmatimonadetes bacterium]|jgi:hypothetical protein|nr:hypothetical protein [Gemmatimonadota bacterium]
MNFIPANGFGDVEAEKSGERPPGGVTPGKDAGAKVRQGLISSIDQSGIFSQRPGYIQPFPQPLEIVLIEGLAGLYFHWLQLFARLDKNVDVTAALANCQFDLQLAKY